MVHPAHMGRRTCCPKCQQVFVLAAETDPEPLESAGQRQGASSLAPAVAVGDAGNAALCAICQSPLAPDAQATDCPGCHSRYHQECWDYNKGCAIYGCAHVPPTEKLDELEMPASYWGQEEKACPACRQTILAAAVRCRYCGATFATAKPQAATDFLGSIALNQAVPAVKRQSMWVIVLCLIPCTAPFAAVGGLIWFFHQRQIIKKLPALHAGLCKVALSVAIIQTTLLLLFAVVHALLG
jgi:hypothetical protein